MRIIFMPEVLYLGKPKRSRHERCVFMNCLIRTGDGNNGFSGYVDRVIEIFFGPVDESTLITHCVFRSEGKWYVQHEAEWAEMGHNNGAGGIHPLTGMTDAEAEAYAEKEKAGYKQKIAAFRARKSARKD